MYCMKNEFGGVPKIENMSRAAFGFGLQTRDKSFAEQEGASGCRKELRGKMQIEEEGSVRICFKIKMIMEDRSKNI